MVKKAMEKKRMQEEAVKPSTGGATPLISQAQTQKPEKPEARSRSRGRGRAPLLSSFLEMVHTIV